jgi:hypothetical protein
MGIPSYRSSQQPFHHEPDLATTLFEALEKPSKTPKFPIRSSESWIKVASARLQASRRLGLYKSFYFEALDKLLRDIGKVGDQIPN